MAQLSKYFHLANNNTFTGLWLNQLSFYDRKRNLITVKVINDSDKCVRRGICVTQKICHIRILHIWNIWNSAVSQMTGSFYRRKRQLTAQLLSDIKIRSTLWPQTGEALQMYV